MKESEKTLHALKLQSRISMGVAGGALLIALIAMIWGRSDDQSGHTGEPAIGQPSTGDASGEILDVVRARKLLIVDQQDNVRVRIEITRDEDLGLNETELGLYDVDGTKKIVLKEDGTASGMEFRSGSAHWERVDIKADPDGGKVTVYNGQGGGGITLQTNLR